jgi:hypothetical protein
MSNKKQPAASRRNVLQHLAKFGVRLPRVPDRQMCEELLEQLLLEAHAIEVRETKPTPNANLTVRYWIVITWLHCERPLAADAQKRLVNEPTTPGVIARMCWQELGDPSPEEWEARLRGEAGAQP